MLWLTVLLSLLLQQIQITFTRSQFYGNNVSFKVIRVRARGFLPYEQDILPYAVISHLLEQQQQLQRKPLERKLPWMRANVQGYMSSQLPPPIPLIQRQIRQIGLVNKEEITHSKALSHTHADAKRYRIYDGDDGERLLDLRIHRYADKDESLSQTENKWKVSAPQTEIKTLSSTQEKKIVQHYYLNLR